MSEFERPGDETGAPVALVIHRSGATDPNNPKALSSWPDGAGGGRPRSALIYVTKDDGGVIGS